MHHELDVIFTLTGGLTAALLFGYITHRVGLSPIVGYLLAGFAVGPFTPGFNANEKVAAQFAEMGVILLMFGVGLQFHLKELLRVRSVAVPGAIAQSAFATLLGIVVALFAGWGWSAGLVFGLAISVASTVVLLRVLADNNDLHTPTGHIAVGWLVVEDLFTVLVLVLLPVLFPKAVSDAPSVAAAAGLSLVKGWPVALDAFTSLAFPSAFLPLPPAAGGNVLIALVVSLVKLTALIAFTFVVGGRVIPWILGHMARSRSRELFTLTVLVTALGIAVGSSVLFGASMALGAFLAGMVVGQSDFSFRAASDALPMRDAFAVLFFVSVGMLFDPRIFVQSPGLVAATIAVILIGKPLAAMVIVGILGYPARVAIAVAAVLAQIGEFSFILANLGRELGILPDVAGNALVAGAILTISLNPVLYRYTDRMEHLLRRWSWFDRFFDSRSTATLPDDTVRAGLDQHRAVVIGYGPVGRTVVRLLRESDIAPTVVEMNLDTVQSLKAEGIDAIYGDASRAETLSAAGVEDAVALLLTASNLHGAEEVIRQARTLNPKIHVSARTGYLREIEPLRAAGADRVFAGEGEVALTLTETLLRQLGATDEQIERESARIRDELLGLPFPAPGVSPFRRES